VVSQRISRLAKGYARDRILTSFDELRDEIKAFAPEVDGRGLTLIELGVAKALFNLLYQRCGEDDGD
jgi:hypothetical protein